MSKKGKKHTSEVNAERIKVNVLGAITINGRSSLIITESSTAPEIAISLMKHRLDNTEHVHNISLLSNIINLAILSDEEQNQLFNQHNTTPEDFINELQNSIELNKNSETSDLARIIGKHCKTNSTNNITKKRAIYGEFIIQLLEKYNIQDTFKEERKIHLILDKYSSHRSNLVKTVAEFLNINLIYLPAYSPHLNPIEQVWKILKKESKHHYILSEEYLENILTNNYYTEVLNYSLMEKWEEKYITIV